jgi:DNA mismatch repair ATPase MutL
MERWAKSWAHQAAMQGTQALSLAARRRLVEDLWGCTQPQIDPLGRPTMTHWTDIEELFR